MRNRQRLPSLLAACAFFVLMTIGVLWASGETPPVRFAQEVQPIFAERCVGCHGANRAMKGLRLDESQAVQAAIHGGRILAAGSQEKSELYRRITLPPTTSGRMPPVGDPLSKEQTELIRRWIAEGTALENATPAQEPSILPAPPEAVSTLEAAGAKASLVAQNAPWLSIDFSLAGKRIGNDTLRFLIPVSAQLRWLNLAKTGVGDAGLAHLAACANLTELHLENTSVTDAGLKRLSALSNLAYLNLYGTKITDAGLEHLSMLPKLKRLFLWKTAVSEETARKWAAERPGVRVELGRDGQKEPGIAWTKDQLAAWNALLDVWRLLDHKDWSKVTPLLHEKWLGLFDETGVRLTPAEWRQREEPALKERDILLWHLIPSDIRLTKGSAVIRSSYYISSKNSVSGAASVERGESMDILIANEESWQLVSTVRTPRR